MRANKLEIATVACPGIAGLSGPTMTSFHVRCTQDSCSPEAVEVKSTLHHYTSNIRALRRERREREASKYTLLQAILRSVGLLTLYMLYSYIAK